MRRGGKRWQEPKKKEKQKYGEQEKRRQTVQCLVFPFCFNPLTASRSEGGDRGTEGWKCECMEENEDADEAARWTERREGKGRNWTILHQDGDRRGSALEKEGG